MNIYVGNLEREVTEDELKQVFESMGEVSTVKIIKDMYSGESKGFAFVEMPANAQAQKAMSELNGNMMNGRPIRVSEARPRRSQGRRGGGVGGGRGGFRQRY